MSEVKAIQFIGNNPQEIADFVGAMGFANLADSIELINPVLSFRVTNMNTYARTSNLVKDGEWVELWKEQTDDEKIEQVIQDKGLEAPRITNDRIDELMSRVVYVAVSRPGDTTSTFVHAFLDGKFMLSTGFSACVDPANFDAEIGFNIAKSNAERQARQKLWELEGYRLYSSLYAIEQNNPKYAAGDSAPKKD